MSQDSIQRFLDDPETKEALSWLNTCSGGEFRTLGELGSVAESIALVQRFYDAGAGQVLAFEINIYNNHQNTGKLVIELPDAGDNRSSVLAIVGEINVSQGYDPEPDFGQTHVFLMLD